MRCAIYTRKSSAEGLRKEFTSLDAQREYCLKYIASQIGEGWNPIDDIYDDGGYSGGNTDRPALQRLLGDIRDRKIDIVVVYKIDRLSRSLRDFLNMVDIFDRHGTSFVSITQAFSTTNSMGRLTLNVLLSFAQFEREVTSERLRDKFAASAARGLWIVGKRPYGYQVVNQRLVIDPAEAKIVRTIYRRYASLQSLRLVAEDLRRRGVDNRNGTPFTDTIIHRMLHNRIYRGERRGVEGHHHEPIVSEAEWARAQDVLVAGQRGRRGRRRTSWRVAILKGLLYGPDGRAYVPAGAGHGSAYAYYVDGRYDARSKPSHRFRASLIEDAVITLLDRLAGYAGMRERSRMEHREFVHLLVARVDVADENMTVTLKTGAKISAPVGGCRAQPLTKWWRLIAPDGTHHEFANLSLWIRSHGYLFTAADVAAFASGAACRANIGLGSLRPGAVERRRGWKGWRWADDAAEAPPPCAPPSTRR